MYMYYFVGYELMMKEENPFSITSSNESETSSIEERSIDLLSEKVKQKVSPADKCYIFVCLTWYFVLLENISLIPWRHHY